jgi:hypothetical protein
MPHPAHYYIRYLLAIEPNPTKEGLNDLLILRGFAELNEEELAEIQEGMDSPPPDFRPWDRTHRPTTQWLKQNRVYSLLHPDVATTSAQTDILEKPRVREVVERLILGNVPESEASLRLAKLGINLTALAIAEFKHYFWNTTLMGLTDWAQYFMRDARSVHLETAYNAALHAGPELAMYRVGIEKELDNKKIMLEVQRELYASFQETKSMPLSHKKVEMLGTLARSLARIDERVQAGDTALQETLKKFEKFKVVSNRSQLPTLHDLAKQGSVSNRSKSEIDQTREN